MNMLKNLGIGISKYDNKVVAGISSFFKYFRSLWN